MTARAEQSFISDFDLHLFNEGNHYRTYEKLGAHLCEHKGISGTHFAVWAPNAHAVSVLGDFNGWDRNTHPMQPNGNSGIWSLFVPDIQQGTLYKFAIETTHRNWLEKMDPYAFAAEVRPKTASKVWELEGYTWQDAEWMKNRGKHQGLDKPMSVYECHIGSWMRQEGAEEGWLSYHELADKLGDYAQRMGFTHVELLPICEHPLDASWGYQTVGYFAPTSRFGSPHDFMQFVDILHQKGVGVLMDWVPSHFPTDAHGLAEFDGTCLFEHSDPRKGRHDEWGTLVFNYSRSEVSNFLISNALFWLKKYHIDGFRVDAVASMLYLDYSRKEGEWIPNCFGGRENLEAVDFIKKFNTKVYEEHPDIVTIAEESTSWAKVSRPTYDGGLGFGMKWDMGWMHDTLEYFTKEPIHRKHHQNDLTFRGLYSFTENFVLALSHDEVVHGKRSMLSKMPGDPWQQFANLRLLYGYMFTQPGKKLLFMGCEFGQWQEWDHESSLDWHLLDQPEHVGLQRWVRDLNTLYRAEQGLHQTDFDAAGFSWVDCNDSEQSILIFKRQTPNANEQLIVACNFTPVVRENYRIGVPRAGTWNEILNSDAQIYGGSGQGNLGSLEACPIRWHNQAHSLNVKLPPLGIVVFKSTIEHAS